ncbi:MAG: carbohydrate ABC transporter substrate-binding protein [Ruminococcus sp.]|nr:carbohydrate ABC transporter substrate-binding protein [Ruminococcus sp.]
MKKILSFLAACGCLTTLTACGSKNKSTITAPDGKLDPCTLRFSWWGGDDRHEATLKAIDLWNDIHPEIKIIPEYGGWDGWTEKVVSQIGSGTEPDILQINYDWLVTMSSDGKGFYDLHSLSSFLDLSGFGEDVLSFGTVDGRLNAVPVSLSGRGLFYNSEVFKRLGVSYPTTWDELSDLGRIFSENSLYPLDLDIQSGGTAWYFSVVYVQQKTGKQFISMDGELGFSEEDVKCALDFYKKLENEHVIRTVGARTDEDGNAALYQSAEFIGGKIAGVLEWGSAVGKYESVLPQGELEAGPFLSDGSGNSSGWMIKPSLMYAVSRNTKYPDDAAEFMNCLLNNGDCAEVLGTSRGIPASRYAEERLEKSGKLTGPAQDSDEMIEKLDTVTVSPYMELSRMKEFYNTAIEKVSYNTADTETAAHELYESMTRYLEKLKK